ncbi:FUSC family protein [Acinetobacter sp.]|uniref:FUSC family protein n=1 Tax=Acinetobacter sp. TaxID=472 RepID=UPI0031CF6E15
MNLFELEKIIYISKILCCAAIITLLSILFDKNKDTNFFLWANLTAFFSLQASSQQRVNFNQISGNLIGSVVGIAIWLMMSKVESHLYYINLEYWFLILGILLSTISCIIIKHVEYTGIALSSFLIVTVYDVSHHTIEGALLRILFCIVGCVIAYFIDLMACHLQQKWLNSQH